MDVFFPPGPQKHLIAGNAPQFANNPFHFLTELPRQYGELVHFRFGPTHAYLVNNPREAHYVLVEAPERFTERPNWLRTLNSAMGHDLFPPKDQLGKHKRQPTTYDPRWLTDYADQISGAINGLGWCPSDTPSLPTHLKAMTTRMTAHILFDRDDLPAGLEEGITYSRPMEDRRFGSPLLPIWMPIGENRKRPSAVAGLNEAMSQLILDTRVNERQGLFSRMLYVSYEQAVDEALALFHAGSDITANTLAWALNLLAQNPDIEAELMQEINTILGERTPTADDLPNLPFTEMVIRETLRLYPPVWVITRQATREAQIGKYYVPAGSTIFVSPYAIHHNPKQYINAEGFMPQRFADGFEKRINRYSYMPFGAGVRASMEESFVVTTSTLLLAGLVGRWRFDSLSQPEIESGLTLKPTPFTMRVSMREAIPTTAQ